MNLQELLGEALHRQVLDKLGDRHRIAIITDGNWLPRAKFDQVNEARRRLEVELKLRDEHLAAAKTAAEACDRLQRQVAHLQAELHTAHEQHQAELGSLRLRTAIQLAIAAEVHDPELVVDLLDMTMIGVDDAGHIKGGLEDQLASLRQRKAYLFIHPKGPDEQSHTDCGTASDHVADGEFTEFVVVQYRSGSRPSEQISEAKGEMAWQNG